MLERDAFSALMKRVREGDSQAAAELVGLYETEIRRFIRYRLATASLSTLFESLDIWQSVMARFFVHLDAGKLDLHEPVQLRKLLMTLAFMSPEQVAGDATAIDFRSDVFNLGGTLFFLLTGKPPYRSCELPEVLQMVRCCQWDEAALQVADVPSSLKQICRRAMASAPEQRYATVDQMAADLDRVVGPGSLRRRWPWILTGLAAMLGIGLWWSGMATDTSPQRLAGGPVVLESPSLVPSCCWPVQVAQVLCL